jgi:trans-aconitate methyltransferase
MEFGPHFDAVFSNAALHWMKDADAVIGRVARALSMGRFVAEMGGSTAASRRGISRTAGRCRPAVAAGLRAHQSAGAVCLSVPEAVQRGELRPLRSPSDSTEEVT